MDINRRDDQLEIRIPRLNGTSKDLSAGRSSTTQPVRGSSSSFTLGTAGARDWLFFVIELRTAMEAGVSFVQGLELVGRNTGNRAIRRMMDSILQQMRQTGSAAKAISNADSIPPLIRNLLVVGLRGGNTPEALQQIVDHYEWILELRGRLLRATAYPMALAILGTGVMIGRDVTIAVMKGSMTTTEALIHYGMLYMLPVTALSLTAIIAGWILYTPIVRPVFDRVVLTVPVIGKLLSASASAAFFRVLALLNESGMPITDAWLMTMQSLPNTYLGRRMGAGVKFLQDGESIQEALRQSGMINRQGLALAGAGEWSGSVPEMLRKFADYEESELKSWLRGLVGLLGIPCMAFIVLGYFVHPIFLGILMFLLVLLRRMV